jgi:hypothetical protein
LDAAADAVRFARQGDVIIYVLERDHSPVEHGILRADETRPLLAAQARMFQENG